MSNRCVILCCPVKNELHNLTRLLPAWQLYSDYIVVADQGSTDGSKEFLRETKGVIIITNNDTNYNQSNRVKLMIFEARKVARDAILLFLDADETLSANVLSSLEWSRFVESGPGTTGYFRWVQLYGSAKRYIAHGKVGTPAHMPFAFVDDGRDFTDDTVMHGPRGPGLGDPTRMFFFNEVVNLHFFLTNLVIFQKKQNWYKLYWLKRGGRYFHINRNHSVYEQVSLRETEVAPAEWYDGFQSREIDVFSAENPTLTWYDVEILNFIATEGARALWLLDIWNQDWERLRRLATEVGLPNIPTEPITGPPRLLSLYNNLMLGRTTPGDLAQTANRFFKRKILP